MDDLNTRANSAALRDTLAGLSTERVNERYADLDLLSTADLVAAMNAEDAGVAPAVALASDAIADAVDGISERMLRGGRLIYIGAGTPGRLGVLDASEAPPTFGIDPGRILGVIAGGPTALVTAVEGAEDDEEAGRGDIASRDVSELDTVVGISASGRTPYVLAAIAEARRRGAFTVGVACNAASDLGAAADVAIDVVVGPELLTGSTRLKAGTAQKMVLNMLSTLVMVRLGKTWGNLMVDLKASNEKLVARSERTVMLATGADAPTAATTLAAVGGSVKAAILVQLGGMRPAAAETLLKQHDGFLRRALAAAAENTES